MRIAEAQVTLGVAAAREGDMEEAASRGRNALEGSRKSPPSLALVAADLADVLQSRYGGEPVAEEYIDQVRSIQQPR